MALRLRRILSSPLIIMLIAATTYAWANRSAPPNLSDHDLLIISPTEFITALRTLRIHKNSNGMPTEILTLERLYDSFSGIDQPEQIKKAIEYYHKKGNAKYVMLVGDSDRFPVRYTAHGQDFAEDPRLILFANSDLYYGALYNDENIFNDWNASKEKHHNKYIGELHKKGEINFDQAAMLPDVAVGRVPASTVAEVDTYVQKIIRYERNANSPRNVLVVSAPAATNPTAYSEKLSKKFSDNQFQVTKLYHTDYDVDDSDILDTGSITTALRNGVRFASIVSHGDHHGWDFLGANDVNTLNNANELPIIFATSCDVAGYAPKEGERYMGIDGRENPGDGGVLSLFDYDPDNRKISSLFHGSQTLEIEGSIEKRRIIASHIYKHVSSNVDKDNEDEIISVVEYGKGEKKVALFVNEVKSDKRILRIRDKRLDKAVNPSITTGNFDGDVPNEIALTVRDGAGQIAILVFDDIASSATTLVRVGDHRIERVSDARAAAGNFDSDSQDEVVIVARDASRKLAILVYDVNTRTKKLSRIGDKRLDRASNAYVTTGNIDGDSEEEIILLATDGNDKLAIIGYGYDERRRELVRVLDKRLAYDSKQDAFLATGDFLGDKKDELAVTFIDQRGKLAVLVFGNENGGGQIKRIDDTRLSDASNGYLCARNLDDEAKQEIVLIARDGGEEGAILVYDMDEKGQLARRGDYRLPRSSTPISIACGNFAKDGTGEIATFFFRQPIHPSPPAPVQPVEYDTDSMAESLLVRNQNGAIAFIAPNTGAQVWGIDLGVALFDGYLDDNLRTLGDMWKHMIEQYYKKHDHGSIMANNDCIRTLTCWESQAEFYQPAKHMLFGDPSLRLQ